MSRVEIRKILDALRKSLAGQIRSDLGIGSNLIVDPGIDDRSKLLYKLLCCVRIRCQQKSNLFVAVL
ncbi:MAG: hypothetical protein ACYSN9_05780 [Planctomycetota bacterium]